MPLGPYLRHGDNKPLENHQNNNAQTHLTGLKKNSLSRGSSLNTARAFTGKLTRKNRIEGNVHRETGNYRQAREAQSPVYHKQHDFTWI